MNHKYLMVNLVQAHALAPLERKEPRKIPRRRRDRADS